ncbi:MAG TPA: hypothetical protein VIF09_02690 [Polyangiaceae bacterium]|jgi:hypothetical protein
MAPRTFVLAFACIGALTFPVALAACSNSNAPTEPNPDSGTAIDSGNPGDDGGGDTGTVGDGGPGQDTGPGCFANPTTYVEIINACTDAAFVDKKPVLPLLQPDGSLPPLP